MSSNAVKAIVFDSNVFGQAVEPNITTIETWADACARHDAALWIPEVVAWELAERVVSAVRIFADSAKAHDRRRAKWGFGKLDVQAAVSVDQVIEAIETAGSLIVPNSDAAVHAALRDQVLVTGPGTRKSGVKTGAADSAWLRSVVDFNDGSLDGIILVTGDSGAVNAICDNLGIFVPRRASHLGELRLLLDEITPPSVSQREAFETTVRAELTSPDGSEVIELAGLDRSNWWSPDLPSEYEYEWEPQESDAYTIDELKYSDQLLFDAWSESVSGRVRVPVQVEESYARQDRWGDAVEYSFVTYEAWIDADVTVYLSGDANQRSTVVGDFSVEGLGVDQLTVSIS